MGRSPSSRSSSTSAASRIGCRSRRSPSRGGWPAGSASRSRRSCSGTGGGRRARLGTYGVARPRGRRRPMDDYAPAAWAAAIRAVDRRARAAAVVAAGSGPRQRGARPRGGPRRPADGRERHRGQRPPASPWRSSASAGPAACSRMRRSTAPVQLLTVAPHAVAVDPATSRAGAERRAVRPPIAPADLVARVVGREAGGRPACR